MKFLESIAQDNELLGEITAWLPEGALSPDEIAAQLGNESTGGASPGEKLNQVVHDNPGYEAIIRSHGRPSLLVRGDFFDIPAASTWKARLLAARDRLAKVIRATGRVEVVGMNAPFVGTAWMIGPEIAVTNRHVALEFARRSGAGYRMKRNNWGRPYTVRIDFLADQDQLDPDADEDAGELQVEEILYIARRGDPDVAFLKMKPSDKLPQHLTLSDDRVESGKEVATVGFPAYDTRNDAGDMARIFAGGYGVKRLAPGNLMNNQTATTITHDCSTLGGASGSAVIDLRTGEVVGLHFGGRYQEENFAVNAATLAKLYAKHCGDHTGGVRLPEAAVAAAAPPEVEVEARFSTEDLIGRDGYDPDFLVDDGEDAAAFGAPMPEFDSAQATRVPDAPDRDPFGLHYTHFSVVMHAERRMAMFTAVNIDGASIHRFKRKSDVWSIDPRIGELQQLDNALYKSNPLDRGHLVRRLDPVWGPEDVAKQAMEDTFFWTNCAPQHEALNRRTWVGLENYILESAEMHGFKACVFTGPIFQDDDPRYRELTRIPQAFWKVVVMRHTETKALVATAYILSQASLVMDLEFAFGEHKTFQVPLGLISKQTGLEFADHLVDADPLNEVESVPIFEISELEDIRL